MPPIRFGHAGYRDFTGNGSRRGHHRGLTRTPPMSTRPFLLPALSAVAALAAGCDVETSRTVRLERTSQDGAGKGVLKVVDALQCPQTQGALTRKGSATAGGTVCSYVGPRGTEVSLHLVALDGGSPAAAPKAVEERLSGPLPQAAAGLEQAAAEAPR